MGSMYEWTLIVEICQLHSLRICNYIVSLLTFNPKDMVADWIYKLKSQVMRYG